jgi:hypothetical protein
VYFRPGRLGVAQKEGLQGFSADVLVENKPVLRGFEKKGNDMEKRVEEGVYELKMRFR